MRARKNSDGSVLAAVYFYDNCIVGTSIMTDVLDINDEPFEMRCTETPDFTGWRVGARFPNAASGWYENYGNFKVRANFEQWDFHIIEKYSSALEIQPDQVIQ